MRYALSERFFQSNNKIIRHKNKKRLIVVSFRYANNRVTKFPLQYLSNLYARFSVQTIFSLAPQKLLIFHLFNETKVLKNTKKCLKVNKNDLWGYHWSRCLSMSLLYALNAKFSMFCTP